MKAHRITKSNLRKLKSLTRRYKPKELYYKVREKLSAPYQDYGDKRAAYLPTPEELARQRSMEFPYAPLVSIVVPTYETPEQFLCQMIDSVIAQTYQNWELCIADGSVSNQVEQTIRGHFGGESRIRYRRLDENGGISANTNQGFAFAAGEYIALLDHDDLLAPCALYEMVRCINETGADFLYSDEDKVSADLSQYMEPHFKLDYNEELLLGNNYICHFLMVKKELLTETGGLDSRYDGAQDFDLVLRLSEQAAGIGHVPRILYHWRVHSGSTAGNTDSKLYAYEAGKRAVEACLVRRGFHGTVMMDRDPGFYRIRYQVPEESTVGILVWPEKGNSVNIPSRLWKNIEQELSACRAKIVWDYQPGQEADFVLVVHRTVKKIAEGSVVALLGSCARPGVGMTGAKTISHGKVVQCGYRNEEGSFKPRFAQLPRHFRGYFRRAFLAAEVDAVSADLAVIDNAVLQAVSVARKGTVTETASEVHERPTEQRQTNPEESCGQKRTDHGRNGAGCQEWLELCSQLKSAGYRIIAEPQAEVTVRG